MNILIVSTDYPDEKRSTFSFVKQIVDQFALMGNNCCVIAPYSITENRTIKRMHDGYYLSEEVFVHVLRPNYLSFSNCKFGKFRPSSYFHERAVNKALSKLPFKPDVIYAHFWGSGLEIFEYAKLHKIPLYIASGESVIPKSLSNPRNNEFFEYVKGVICVSTKNKDESIELGLTVAEKCIVIPNGVNGSLFHVMDKQECRKRLNLPENVFIVAFVGWFTERKGVNRVAQAINMIEGETVYSMFIGGTSDIVCDNILIKDRVAHNELPVYLNAADVFVLPTLHEGCCNAVIEAMACGLPIISSNLPFNWDILNASNSILVDPNNIEQISMAITEIRDNIQLRNHLIEESLNSVRNLSIVKGAHKILDFMNIES